MILKYLLQVIILFSFISCQKKTIKEEYFKDGSIKTRSFFNSKNDTLPYLIVNFYECHDVKDSLYFNNKGELNGKCFYNLKKKKYWYTTHYINGIEEGERIIHFENGYKIYQWNKDGKLNCIQHTYKNNILASEFLLIEGETIARKIRTTQYPGDTIVTAVLKDNGEISKSFKLLEDTVMVEEYSLRKNLIDTSNKYLIRNPDDKYVTIGSLVFRNGKLDKSSSDNWYVSTSIEDTVKIGQELNLELGSYQDLGKEVSAVVKIGKLNSNFELSEIYSELELESANFEMGIGVISDSIGYNLLTGIVYYKRNDKVIREALIFEDYYVSPR